MTSGDVAIRNAEIADLPALLRLADLDSRRLPDGRLLLAEVDGQIVAARSSASGAVVADPFVPTAELQELLALRAAQVESSAGRRARAWRRRVLGDLLPRQA